MKIKANEKLFNEAKSSCNVLKQYCDSFNDFFCSIVQNDMTFSERDYKEWQEELEKAKKRLRLKMKQTYDGIEDTQKKIKQHIWETNQ